MKVYIALLVTVVLFSSCNRKSAREYYEEAAGAYAKQDFRGTIALFEQAVEREPQSAYAESSQYQIAMVYNNDLHETRNSLAAYRKFREMYPSSKQAPTALFLSAFLYNNDLHLIDSAKIEYEEFLRLYPDHELATSAKFELESLGKDPMHILQSQHDAADQKAAATAEPKPVSKTEAKSKDGKSKKTQ